MVCPLFFPIFLLKVANTLINVLDGASDADTVLKSAKVVTDSYEGLVECGIINDDDLSDRVKARIKSGDQVLDILVILDEDD